MFKVMLFKSHSQFSLLSCYRERIPTHLEFSPALFYEAGLPRCIDKCELEIKPVLVSYQLPPDDPSHFRCVIVRNGDCFTINFTGTRTGHVACRVDSMIDNNYRHLQRLMSNGISHVCHLTWEGKEDNE